MKFILNVNIVSFLLITSFLWQVKPALAQQIGLSDPEIEAVRINVLTDAMKSSFWLQPENTIGDVKYNPHGVAAYTFASYYLNQNTSKADEYILAIKSGDDLHNDSIILAEGGMYFYIPNLFHYILDERFNNNIGATAKNHLVDVIYRHLDVNADYRKLNDVWEVSGSENHNALRRALAYLGGVALSQSNSYGADYLFSDNKTVGDCVSEGTLFWKEYFRSRVEKGLEIEIHSPTYTKYTLSCFYAIRDLAADEELKTLADLYLHLYWADKAQLYLSDNGIVGGAANRVYKKYINIKFALYPRDYMRLFGWTTQPWGNHPAAFVPLVTHYRVPELISQIASSDKPNYLIHNVSNGMVKDGGAGINPYDIIFDQNGSSNILSQSYVTPNYVMGTKLLNPAKDYANIVLQNNMSGVFFDDSDNNRIIINGYSKISNGEEKGYRDVVGVTGKNCMVAWRPAEYDASNALGTYVFMSTKLKLYGEKVGDWWFVEMWDAYVAVRVANGDWTERAIDGTTDGINFLLTDADSPVIIECAQPANYNSYADFKNEILSNNFSFSNNVLNYTSSAGDTYKVSRQSSSLPEMNGQVVVFNRGQTYSSPYINGGTTALPLKVDITFGDKKLAIDYANLTMENITTGIDDLPEEELKLLVYPNPSHTGRFYLNDTYDTWQVFSVAGRLVKQGNSSLIDISDYNRGIYLLKMGNKYQKIVY